MALVFFLRVYSINLGNLYERQELQDSVLFFYNKALLYYQHARDSVGIVQETEDSGAAEGTCIDHTFILIWIVLNGIIKSHYNGFITTDI